jgi:hypothetical protein
VLLFTHPSSPAFPMLVFETGFNYDFGNGRCKKLTSARKQMFMLRAPKVLVIQLKVIDLQSFLILYWDKWWKDQQEYRIQRGTWSF